MKKIILFTTFILFGYIGLAQTLICWRNEMVKYNPKSGEYEAISKGGDKLSEAFFNDKYIRVGDIRLTKKKMTSTTKSMDGIVTLFDVVDETGTVFVATVVEDKQGIFKMLLTIGDTADYGMVYFFKNR